MAETLQSIDNSANVDKRIILPNGTAFVRNKKSNSISDRAIGSNGFQERVRNLPMHYLFRHLMGDFFLQTKKKAGLPPTPVKLISQLGESSIERQLITSR